MSVSRAADDPPPFAEPRDESAGYRVETILTGLDHPASIAVRPGSEGLGTAELFVSESGAGQVLRVLIDEPEKSTPVIAGFPVKEREDEPAIRVGPLGLAFLSRNRLAVGTGGLGDGADQVRVYSMTDGSAAIAYEDVNHAAGPVAGGSDDQSGPGAFWSLAATDRALFVVAHNGVPAGGLLKATLDANRIAGLEPFFNVRATAATVDPRPQHQYLVVARRGEPGAEAASRISMYSPASGAEAITLNTGLRDIVALAYSPAPSFDLYAADFSHAEPNQGGIYRIEAAQVDGRESCRAVKIAVVTRPTALTFTGDGAMFVTAFGESTDDDDDGGKPAGVVLKLTPQGNTPRLRRKSSA